MAGWHLLIDRDDIRRTSVVESASPPLSPGEVRLRIDSFGLTANNVTYAAAGDMIGYWNFFPAPRAGDGVNWGRSPVWGFADVVESRCDGVGVGERLYGYLPMSSELVILPVDVSPRSLTDGSAHRSMLPSVYNRLTRCSTDPGYDPSTEDMQALLRPLFMTSFLIDDFLDDQEFFGASTVVLTSASSKTAFGTAYLLAERDGIEVVGLTSSSNVGFVEALGCYDSVVPYSEVASLPVTPTVLVDIAGDAGVIRAVHEHFGDSLRHSAAVGLTHWEDRGASAAPLPGPPHELFFAPDRFDKRHADWGRGVVERRMGEAWGPFIATAGEWLRVEHHRGASAIAEVWAELVDGTTAPDVTHMLHP